MQQGKHTEYEKNLHEELLAATAAAEMAESTGISDPAATTTTNGGTTTTTSKLPSDAKTSSRTPSPKVGSNGSGSGGWPNLSSASSTPTNSAGSSGSLKGSNNINNNFRNDPSEDLR